MTAEENVTKTVKVCVGPVIQLCYLHLSKVVFLLSQDHVMRHKVDKQNNISNVTISFCNNSLILKEHKNN